jgi:hypothetical protein
MSIAPKRRGVDKRIVYGLIAVSLVMLLLCGGIFVTYIWNKLDFLGGGSVTPVNTKAGARPKTFKEDAVLKPTDAAEGFLGAIANEEFGQAIKQFSTVGFQGRWSSSTLREEIEKKGKGLIGWKSREPLRPVSQTQDSKVYQCEVGGGSYGSARVEITVSQDEAGWRVSEFVVQKK